MGAARQLRLYIYTSFNAICFRSRGILYLELLSGLRGEYPIIRRKPINFQSSAHINTHSFHRFSLIQILSKPSIDRRERTMDRGNQEIKPKKTKGLRSKRRPRQFHPLNTASSSAITAPVTVGNTISDYVPTTAYTFSPLEVEVAEALVLLAHGDRKSVV